MWLCYRWRSVLPPYPLVLRAVDLDRCPCPAISSNGVGAAGFSRHWLAADLPAGAIVSATPAPPVDKPAYRVPTIAEIREIPWNGLNVVSAFSGAGGSSTGYRMSGYRVLAAAEFVPAAADSYEANKADYTVMLRRDVRGLEVDEVLDAIGLQAGELDLLDGSPPCEPFSSAGKREKTWNSVREYSGQQQRTDDLFYEFARLVEGIRPRAFVAENVPGLARGRARGYFRRILAALRDCGYRVEARTLDAAWLGVPQHRQRIIFVGIRNDLEADPVFPAPLPYQYTVRDAIGELLTVRVGGWQHYENPQDVTDGPAPTVVGGDTGHWHIEPRALMGSFRDKERPPEITDQPAPTVVAGDSAYWHVEQVCIGHEFKATTRSLDEPAATVMAQAYGGRDDRGTNADLVIEQVYGGHGFHPEEVAKSIDEPAHTVDASAGGKRPNQADLRISGPAVIKDTGGKRQAQRRDRLDEPAPTVAGAKDSTHLQVEFDQQTVGNEAFEPTFGPLDQAHPTVMAEGARTSGELRSSSTRERRRFTIAELKRICGFPDDFVLTGSFSQQWERLGDAVPPPMAAAVGRALADGPLAK